MKKGSDRNIELKKAGSIYIHKARVHNLKDLSVDLPHNKFIVITGLSGSGKSSLAFDTLYAEGQRRYVESLSSYARQFLGRMSKPEVEYIHGIAPAIAIEQKIKTFNPRSTVGTSTEIYDYLKLLFARIGKTFSPVSGAEVMRHTVSDVVDHILSFKDETKVIICFPLLLRNGRNVQEEIDLLGKQGFTRFMINSTLFESVDIDAKTDVSEIKVIADRIVLNSSDASVQSRIADSVQTAFYEGDGLCVIECIDSNKKCCSYEFSNRFEADNICFEEPSVNMFTFNNPFGACKKCEGFGSIIGIDEDLVIPNRNLSIYEDAIVCWKGEKMGEWKNTLVNNAYKFDFPIHKPVFELTIKQLELLWSGNKYFHGLHDFFKFIEEQAYKIQYRVMLSRYRGKTQCPDCKGTRLRADAAYVKIGGKSIIDLLHMPVIKVMEFFANLELNNHNKEVSKCLFFEIINRLKYLDDVGLGYLSLNRASNTLSGGESQRINLATALGSSLTGSLYILDEPSVGLHPRDTHRLISVLKNLRDLGNTVIVVEHDEDIIRAADLIVDIGPQAGTDGGNLVFKGICEEIIKCDDSITGLYLAGKLNIPVPQIRRKWRNSIIVEGCRENNLKNIDVIFPLNALTVVTGVSGSGKTSLVKKILYNTLKKLYGGVADKSGKHNRIYGDLNAVSNTELVDQNPIGRSSRSNPATYIKAYDEIRSLYADQKLSKVRGYKPGYFSFNTEGGRCEDCQGDGYVKIEMQFMADINLVCESCGGKRFREEVLDVRYNDKNITDILEMTVKEAVAFFSSVSVCNSARRITDRLQPLVDVGLDYVKLGQPTGTLSGGEAQRLKLASFLSHAYTDRSVLFIFDEPTTGLHFHDISKLYSAFDALIEKGHSVIVIEHNPEIIKCADWIIDLGPDGGENGGELLFAGTPEDLTKCSNSFTGKFLEKKIII